MFNKSDYTILDAIIGNECTSPFQSISTQYIIDKCGYSHVKVRQVLKNFVISDFIREGIKDGNKKTYYVTEKGKAHYMMVMGYNDEDIEDLIYEYREINNRDENKEED